MTHFQDPMSLSSMTVEEWVANKKKKLEEFEEWVRKEINTRSPDEPYDAKKSHWDWGAEFAEFDWGGWGK